MMAGFRKAKAEQAALKIGMYGPSGSGKTFTALLIAEGLAKITGKRIAFVDTERGTDFYCKTIPERKLHPQAFDFDALYTKSITEVIQSIKGLPSEQYGVIVLDSITHIWEAARLAYDGKETRAGTIPFHAWAKIKKPYKELINLLLSSPMHVIFCGRQGNEFEEDEESGELKKVGVKMKAEGETPYEPHVLLRMEAVKDTKSKLATITVFAEKDRTGILAGQTIIWPTFDNLAKPLLAALGGTQAVIKSDDETSQEDAVSLMEGQKAKESESYNILGKFQARFSLCEDFKQLNDLNNEITPELKKKMTTADVADLKEAYLTKARELKGLS
uniref:Putative ATPase domain containing protein n=1 Tax=viral metagenome TaxID=1070528 RepID=A0A6M3LFY1_9ZZZZ